ncbi:signal peptidase II [Streptomyces durmitorensis]|uniref:Lipoprotein signal peptidase n=1 Tax=Streptomyces durmitorensis TaxID=319947 RepID=A0ABY4PZ61_9ACTN|nr:signal peptidase II [Streptomyces durmitorensis]UQT59086.1 signal peptidase II [Streptomyces durmitorensis]
MAEAERIIGTPDIPEAAGTEPEQSASGSGEATGRSEQGERAAKDERTSSDEQASPDEQRPKGKRKILVLFAVAVLAYALDLVSKMIVVAKLEHHEPIEIIGDWLQFNAIRNAGAAFGIGEAFTVIFTCIAAAVIVVIARLARKLYSMPWAIALGMLLGGALGNLTDRIFRAPGVFEGAVVDFIAPKGFAVFNLADSAIVCGGFLIVILSFRGLDPDGTVHKD